MLRGTTTAPLEIRTSRQVFVCAETSKVAPGLVNWKKEFDRFGSYQKKTCFSFVSGAIPAQWRHKVAKLGPMSQTWFGSKQSTSRWVFAK